MNVDGKMLKEARELLEMTQAELADKLEVSLRTIVNWEAAEVPRKSVRRVRELMGNALKHLEETQSLREWEETPEGAEHLQRQYELHVEDMKRRKDERSAMMRKYFSAYEPGFMEQIKDALESIPTEFLIQEILRRELVNNLRFGNVRWLGDDGKLEP